ncbi:CDF family Co(II)/Ni(II) efflux transporter DmeF [Orrella sp. NBD-18]|uniref:CDF family Co(II)/Ni(II) efflux transporter DmeF n=1 Tax=Sheuella amnicola TaxID=2707330 RepID=A0A6B2R9Q3_9BURK|nr:CDF family Co(II)/Ni(II) efflux transporter DmeF [Sheuella amnicola]NDY84005.1 CDF family Co(II)/Ni(II) efflux transporter DmeF [Sheuella amnicola]
MHLHDLSEWAHDHIFDTSSRAAEKSTRLVMWVTLVMMVFEIAAGWWYNSMALLADGWHMSSHAVAIGLSAFAYSAARRYSRDARFAFGTWKIEILGGFASAVFLLCIAGLMVFGSVERIVDPQPIHYQEAIVVAVIGLIVNLVCAIILGRVHHDDHHDHSLSHSHGHQHEPAHGHSHGHAHHHDLNLKSAYVHVIADAATSLLAIIALLGGWFLGWSWLDPVMGLVGAVLVAVWAKGLIQDTGKILLDREMDHPVVNEIRDVVEGITNDGETKVTDLHVWRVGKTVYSCALTVVTHDSTLTPSIIRQALSIHEEIIHSTIEIHLCPDAHA